MLPGSISFCWSSPWASLASVTVGVACAFVHCTRACWFRARLMSPFAAMAPAAIRAIMPTSRSWRGESVLRCGGDMWASLPSGFRYVKVRGCVVRRLAIAGVDDAEHCRYQEKRRAGCEQQPAYHSAAKRRILAGLDRHRDHADDHRKRGHEHRPETGAARLKRGGHRV